MNRGLSLRWHIYKRVSVIVVVVANFFLYKNRESFTHYNLISFVLAEDGKEEHKNETEAFNFLGFDQAAETMIKKVKQALADGEGCRVLTSALVNRKLEMLSYWGLRKLRLIFLAVFQVYGVLDVQRVAGNFHISVHGLNIYVAQMVGIILFYKHPLTRIH